MGNKTPGFSVTKSNLPTAHKKNKVKLGPSWIRRETNNRPALTAPLRWETSIRRHETNESTAEVDETRACQRWKWKHRIKNSTNKDRAIQLGVKNSNNKNNTTDTTSRKYKLRQTNEPRKKIRINPPTRSSTAGRTKTP